MAWRDPLTYRLGDAMRFALRALWWTSFVALSMGSAYVLIKLTWFTVRWLDRVLFNEPW